MITDTVAVPQYHFSINPIALGLLGLDIDLLIRFKSNPLWAFHFPLRLHTYFGNTFLFHTGLGMNYMAYNTDRINLYFGAAAQLYLAQDDGGVGVPLTIGLITNLTERLTLHFSGGGGPMLGSYPVASGIFIPDFHFGLGFKFGDKFTVTSTNKQKVWKE